ncbi:MAG TPA: GntR family transcriptional regulator [Azospirillaceae bacterium]|nr:GntR family transcriptional regulator [Azospirillaceae bacterium]
MPATSQLGTEIAQQILGHIRRQRLNPGARLTERALAAEFGVSRSPIRAALKLLADKGVLAPKPESGGYVLARTPDEAGAEPEVPASPVEALYLGLVRDRFAREIPDEVSEADLMRRYDVSRAMLMHALVRLANEGLVQRRRGHGWRFLPIIDTADADWESYEFRLAIEPAAIRAETFRADLERLRQCRLQHVEMLAGLINRVTGARFFETNIEFHEMLAEFSGNRYFLQSIQQQNRLRRAAEYESFVWSERMRESCQEHINILDALIAGDREWAAALMVHHLKLSQRSNLPFRGGKAAPGR